MTAHRALYPAGAALLSVVLILAAGWAGSRPGPGTFLLGLIPLAMPVLWGTSLLAAGGVRQHLLAAAICLAMLSALTSAGAVIAGAAYVACGLAVAWGLDRGWRGDAVLGLALLPVVLLSLSTVGDASHVELFEQAGREHVATLREQLPDGGDPDQRAVLLDEYERTVETTVEVMLRIWPALLFLSLLFQAGVAFLLVRWLGKGPGRRSGLRPLLPFHRWRVPFYWVWVLVGGLVLFATRSEPLVATGLNVVLVAAVLLAVQGLAVHVFLIGRLAPPWLRILFWLAAALLVVPLLLVLAGSVLLGLADQWLDFRRRITAAADGD
jgi:hypothetical protein